MSSFLPLAPGPQLDTGRLLGTWCDPDNTQLLSRPRPHHPPSPRPPPFPPFLSVHSPPSSVVSSPLENSFTSLSNYPVQWPSCRSDRTHVTTRPGVSCHACPLTFPTLRVRARARGGGGRRRKKAPLLPPWLPKCYHMVQSLPHSLSHGSSFPLCLSLPSLSLGLSLIAAQTSESFMI